MAKKCIVTVNRTSDNRNGQISRRVVAKQNKLLKLTFLQHSFQDIISIFSFPDTIYANDTDTE